MALYIDDGLIAASDGRLAIQLIKYLQTFFEVKVSDAEFYLGLEIEHRSDGSIHLNQSSYSERLLQKFNTSDCHPVCSPAEASKFTSSDIHVGKFPFREAVGSLMYLAVATRPDISYALGVVLRLLDNPSVEHANAVKRIFKYVKGTRTYGILFKNNFKFNIDSYSDADYAGDIETRRSTSGFVFLINETPICWASQRQKSVSLSTTEAEYIAASEAVKELVWVKSLFQDLLPEKQLNAVLLMDNQSALKLVKNPQFHKRTKHVDIQYHFIREKFKESLFDLVYVPMQEQIVDILTKPLSKVKFCIFLPEVNNCT